MTGEVGKPLALLNHAVAATRPSSSNGGGNGRCDVGVRAACERVKDDEEVILVNGLAGSVEFLILPPSSFDFSGFLKIDWNESS